MNAVRPPLSSADLVSQAEAEVLRLVAAHLGKGNVETADWKFDRLRRMGALTAQIEDIVNAYRQAVLDGVVTEVEQAALDQLVQAEGIFDRAKKAGASLADVLPPEADPAIQTTIKAWQTSARQAYNLSLAKLIEGAGTVYVDTLNRTTLQLVTGAMTGRQALVTTIREWAQTGVPSIVDAAGRQWSTEAYTRMVHRTNITRVTHEVQLVRAREYGCDLIEVSAHAGARPGCAPYQGRVFSLSGQSEKYPALASTSYGEPAGLFGINCGHHQYPFFEGISRQTYAPTQDPEENDRVYRESQQQRALERGIRAAKRDLAACEGLGDDQAAADARREVRDRQAALRSFIERTGRTRRRDREQIYDPAPAGPTPKVPPSPEPPKRVQPPTSVDELRSRLPGLSEMVLATTGARYIGTRPATLWIENVHGNRGVAQADGNFAVCKDVGKSLEGILKSGVIDAGKEVDGPYNQAVNFRTLVHEHMHLHGRPWDVAKFHNKKYITMLETVNDLSAVYMTKSYATELGLRWNVPDSADIRSPGYSYCTTTFERIFRIAGKSDAEIQSLVIQAKAELEIDEYDSFFKTATGRMFPWSFAKMLENSMEGLIYLKKFLDLVSE